MTVEISDESKSQDEAKATSTSVWSNFNDMQFCHIVIISIFSSMSYALPDVYLSLFLIDRFDLSVGMTGIVRAAMILTPLLGILLTMAIPRVSGIVLLPISVAGYCCLLFLGEGNMIWFIVGNTASAVTGASPYIQVLAKNDFGRDIKKMCNVITFYNIFCGLGYGVGSYLSGALYQSFGIRGIGVAGASLQTLSFVSLCHYLFLTESKKRNRQNDETDKEVEEEEDQSHPVQRTHKGKQMKLMHQATRNLTSLLSEDSERECNCAKNCKSKGEEDGAPNFPMPNKSSRRRGFLLRRPTLHRRPAVRDIGYQTERAFFAAAWHRPTVRIIRPAELESNDDVGDAVTSEGDVEGKIKACVRRGSIDNSMGVYFSESDLVRPSLLVKLIPVMLAFEGVTVGGFQTIGPIYITEIFGRSESEIGMLVAVSTVLGTALSLGIESDTGSHIYGKIFSSPNDMCTFYVVIALSIFLLLVPSFSLHALSVGVIMIFNEPLRSKMYELQVAVTTMKHYRLLGPLGEFMNLSVELVVSLVVPFLYGIHYFLPYAVLGTISALFTAIFVCTVKLQSQRNTQKLSEFDLDVATVDSGDTGDGKVARRRLSFTDREILAQISVRDLDVSSDPPTATADNDGDTGDGKVARARRLSFADSEILAQIVVDTL